MSISKNFIDKREKSLEKNEFTVFLLRNSKILVTIVKNDLWNLNSAVGKITLFYISGYI